VAGVPPAEDLPEIRATSPSAPPATEDEFAHIRAHGEEPWLDLFELAGWAGLRCIEIHRLQREDMTERQIRVNGKGGKWRAVPTHPELWARFAGRPAGPVARGPDGVPLTGPQVIRRGDYYLQRMGLGLSMHQLRKRFATQIYRTSGHDIRLVQQLLGHASVKDTQRYIGVDATVAAEVVTAMRVAT
jgi:integrase